MNSQRTQLKAPIIRLMSLLGAAAACIFAVAIPSFYLVFSISEARHSLTIETSFLAKAIEKIIQARPDVWQFETPRLQEIVSQPSIHGERDEREIRNAVGMPVTKTDSLAARPAVTVSVAFFDSGRLAGSIQSRRSIGTQIIVTALLGVFSSFLSYLIYFIFRTYPIRMLESTLNNLHREKDRSDKTLQAVGDGVISVDSEGNIQLINRRAEVLLGWKASEAVGRPLEEVYVLSRSSESRIGESLLIARAGGGQRRIISEFRSTLQETESGESGTVIVFRDITERKKAREALEESEAKYRDLYENAPDMYYSVDTETGIITECNETLARTTGFSKEELLGRPVFDFYHEDCIEDAKKLLQQFPDTGEVRGAERRVKCKDGNVIDVILNVSAVKNGAGKIIYSRSIWHDITERKKYEEMIRTLSITDQLTGLYNRRGFMTLAEQQLRVANRKKINLLLLFADLDDLKKINDKSGHNVGDKAIIEMAEIFREVFRKMDIIARIGGDEFAVLASEASMGYSSMIQNRLADQLAVHNARKDREFNISISLGAAYYDPEQPSTLDNLISRADSLMYEHKTKKQT